MADTPIREQVALVIATHPHDVINLNDVYGQLPEVNAKTVYYHVSKFMASGLIKNVSKARAGTPAQYRIIDRETLSTTKSIRKKSRNRFLERKAEAQMTANGLTLSQIGEAMVARIRELEQKARDISDAYSNLQSELSKEVAANRLRAKESSKKIDELKTENKVLRDRLRAKEKTFTIGELTGR